MIATPEIVSSLTGAVRLALGDTGAMSCFNRTIEGFWNSFFAAVLAAPGYLALALLSFEETPIADPLRVFLVESIAYVIGWVAFPLAMVYVARALGREKRYVNYIVAFNWAQVPQVLLFLTGVLTNMPKAVLGAIVFLVGIDLIDVNGLRRVWAVRRSEFYIAVLTAVVVFAVGVEQGIILAIVASLIEMVRRQYHPHRFVVGVSPEGHPTFTRAEPGIESAPGLLVFRYDADLFYANANQFADDVQQLMTTAPSRIRWLVLDRSSIPDVDYSAGAALHQLVTYVHNRGAHFALAAPDPHLRAVLSRLGVLKMLNIDHVYDTVEDAIEAADIGPLRRELELIDGMTERGWGRIVNLSSVNGQRGQFGQTNYSAAKAGIHGFTKALALEVARKGVTVNTISPGYIGTKMVTAIPKDILDSKIIPQIPLGRLGKPEEVAGLCAYLASDEAAFVTGANIAINGGQPMY